MKLNPFILSSAAVFALSCVATAAAYYYKSRNREINDVMVFCKLQFNPWGCFEKLMRYIEAANKSVNICMPSIHNPAIQGKLVQLITEKNIKVRIIIDRNGYNDRTDFFLKELADAGAEIKCRVSEPYNKHHKFCLIDDQVLMTGTLNWGDDRSGDPWNYVYVTNKPRLVDPVKNEFYQMWSIDMALEEAIKTEPADYESDDNENTVEVQLDETDEYGTPTVSVQDLDETCMHKEKFEASFKDPLTKPEFCVM